MLLGKRQRPPMKRTTSMTEFTLDLNSHPNINININPMMMNINNNPPKVHRRNSADYTHNFLTACHLCKRPLIAGRDIFMYRGDSAFCSLECRQQQMNQDEKKDIKHATTNSPNPNSDTHVLVAL